MIAKVRRLVPKALTMRTLMVGCAAGEGHLDHTSDEQARWVADCLHGALRSYASSQKCGWSCSRNSRTTTASR